MSTPEPPSSPEVAPADNRQICPCCQQRLGVRQIQRHLLIAHGRELGGIVVDTSGEDSDLADDEMDLDDEAGSDLAEDVVGGDLEAPGTRLEVAQPDVGVDLGGEILEQQGMEVNPENAHADDFPEPPQGLRRNPPVRIEEWPDVEANFDLGPGSDEGEDEPIDGPDRDPEFEERDEAPAFIPIDEPRFTHEEVRRLLHDNLGDLADEQWIDMYARVISKQDQDMLSMLATRLRTHFSRSTWDDLRHGVCKDLDIPSEFIAWRRLRILAGKYKDLDMCPYCDEPRYNSRGTARRVFHYTPLIPQLRGLFQNRDMAAKLRYRVEVEQNYDPDVIEDVFDGEHYRSLRGTKLRPDSDYRIFDNPEDIALGISTDGFTLFKRRRRGLSTAWPIILVNYNLHPRIRTRLQNVICVGVVPGPKQCKDLNSFLIPLLEELPALEDGVETTGINPEGEGIRFLLRAFVILGFGDIPAVAKLLLIKAHNALTPCRACYIQGVLCQLERNAVYYLPLTDPDTKRALLIDEIPMRTHQDTLARLAHLDRLETRAEREEASREYGLTGRSIFTHLKSIDLASCFPYDLMHLIFENLVPNMIRHWTGDFKGLDEGNGAYRIPPMEWEAVGKLTAQATKTIPASFVGTLPNICTDRTLYKAEAYSFWIQYIAPILLEDRLPEPYYSHLLLLREVVIYCLKLTITREEVDELERLVNQWVLEYEEYYYQYERYRLPTCPLTIHALIHIPFYIRRTGPLWASWAFVMERFCGHILPAVKNRTRPYEHLDNYVQRRAQMQVVSVVYNMRSLAKPLVNYRYENGVEISSREVVYPDFPDIVLGIPVTRNIPLVPPLVNQLTRFFGVVREDVTDVELRARIDPDSIIRYGRFRIAHDGDHMRTAALVDKDPIARDNSFVKYDLLPDANASDILGDDEPIRQTHYGRLLDVFYLIFTEDDGTRAPYVVARVLECPTEGLDAASPENPRVTYRQALMARSTPTIVHIDTIYAVVGRVRVSAGEWAIVDQSRENARPQFVDAAGNVEFE